LFAGTLREMKLKQQPDDFQVEELTDVVPGGRGAFAFYRLEKRGWTTFDAVAAVQRRWQLEPGRISYGGLKDRHAHTAQHLTIFHGPRRGLKHHAVTLHYLGQIDHPFSSSDMRANRFHITLRDVEEGEAERAVRSLEEIRTDGVPNYFDDQRFGSVGEQHEFVAKALIQGEYEKALRLALATPYRYDRAEQKKEKAVLQAHWGDWPRCKTDLARCHARSLVDYLVHHPTDFRGAFARMRHELSSLHLSAYQSYLWNRMLASWLEGFCQPDQLIRVPLVLDEVPMHRGLDPVQRRELAALALPLPSARLRLEGTDPRRVTIDAVLAHEGFPLSEMKIRGPRKPFFSRGERLALCLPTKLRFEIGDDEKHTGRRKLLLEFELPRGSYATLVVKRLQWARVEEPEEGESEPVSE
jgi:tRNA pseudouridine13 synthase